jgi:hypothetical protein
MKIKKSLFVGLSMISLATISLSDAKAYVSFCRMNPENSICRHNSGNQNLSLDANALNEINTIVQSTNCFPKEYNR